MSARRHLIREAIVDAAPEVVFAALTDWPTQGQWMLGTRVQSEGPAQGVGGRLSAFTGVGRVGFWDTMEITQWEPPRLVAVLHTGRVVRGPGIFEVLPLPEGRSRLVWREELELPLGALGRAGFALVGPMFAAGVVRSLRRFAALVASGELGSPGGVCPPAAGAGQRRSAPGQPDLGGSAARSGRRWPTTHHSWGIMAPSACVREVGHRKGTAHGSHEATDG